MFHAQQNFSWMFRLLSISFWCIILLSHHLQTNPIPDIFSRWKINCKLYFDSRKILAKTLSLANLIKLTQPKGGFWICVTTKARQGLCLPDYPIDNHPRFGSQSIWSDLRICVLGKANKFHTFQKMLQKLLFSPIVYLVLWSQGKNVIWAWISIIYAQGKTCDEEKEKQMLSSCFCNRFRNDFCHFNASLLRRIRIIKSHAADSAFSRTFTEVPLKTLRKIKMFI